MIVICSFIEILSLTPLISHQVDCLIIWGCNKRVKGPFCLKFSFGFALRKKERKAMSNASSEAFPPTKAPARRAPRDCDEDSDSDDEEYRRDPEKWDRYFEQIAKSQGFDIIDYPGHCFMASYVPIDLRGPSPSKTDSIAHATLALGEYNNKSFPQTMYVFENLVTVNVRGCAGLMYYITFEAKETKGEHSVVETFQAKVWEGIKHTTVEFCRLKKEAPQGEYFQEC